MKLIIGLSIIGIISLPATVLLCYWWILERRKRKKYNYN